MKNIWIGVCSLVYAKGMYLLIVGALIRTTLIGVTLSRAALIRAALIGVTLTELH